MHNVTMYISFFFVFIGMIYFRVVSLRLLLKSIDYLGY